MEAELKSLQSTFTSLENRVGTKNPAQFYPPGFIRFYPAGKTQKNRVILGFIKKTKEFEENIKIYRKFRYNYDALVTNKRENIVKSNFFFNPINSFKVNNCESE